MMRASELRIGNWVQGKPLNIPGLHINGTNGRFEITGFGISLMESDMQNAMGFRPIPFDEEWLLKMGFKRESARMLPSKFHYANGGPITFYSSDIAIKVYGNYMYNIKYVHQLQNLYFALTGEELTLK